MVLPRLSQHSYGIAAGVDAKRLGAAGEALRRDGFAMIDRLFTHAELREVERLLDGAIEAAAHIPAAQRFVVRYPADKAADGVSGGWDQLELNHATTLVPALLHTAVFRRCTALAHALAGPVSRSFDHAIYKGPQNRTPTPWHQDAAFKLWRGAQPRHLHFWIPLQDVTLESGCMEFIAGSHRLPLLDHYRILRTSGLPGREAVPEASGRIPCPLAAGGLTIHTPMTLHCAGANVSTVPRKAWILQYGPLGGMRLALKRLAGALPQPLRSDRVTWTCSVRILGPGRLGGGNLLPANPKPLSQETRTGHRSLSGAGTPSTWLDFGTLPESSRRPGCRRR